MLARCGAPVARSLLLQVKAGEKSISRGGLGLSIPSHLRSTSSGGRHLSTSSVLNRKMVSKLSTEERSTQLQPLLAKGQWHFLRRFDLINLLLIQVGPWSKTETPFTKNSSSKTLIRLLDSWQEWLWRRTKWIIIPSGSTSTTRSVSKTRFRPVYFLIFRSRSPSPLTTAAALACGMWTSQILSRIFSKYFGFHNFGNIDSW